MSNSDENIKLIVTEDGSHTLFVPHLNETYHSRHGAVREAEHVFIRNGLLYAFQKMKSVNLLEVGFGTGLNALLTLKEVLGKEVCVNYVSLETAAVPLEIIEQLNYNVESFPGQKEYFKMLHSSPWNQKVELTDNFSLQKINQTVQDFHQENGFDLIYYDAFGPPAQPEMWVQSIFDKMFGLMNSGGVLVTYCAKGQVRRNMMNAGFIVERLPGPPGKREMLRATKE